MRIRVGETQRFNQGNHHVRINHRLTDGTIQYAIERIVVRLLKTRRIEEQKLRRFVRQNAGNAVTRGLCLIGRNADFLANEVIEQS